ncbi:guanitoxin biosynthesis L-enduracididine beta-hydroxylase GntD [Nonomuraea fuscirosea]|uniref:guanitoxin biosynthesis L-enduracididine beta-hydroxylase GntD n=1 Tax=Nonomuraea fuscirosea TaxID=1291556 RepID=UPI00342106D0
MYQLTLTGREIDDIHRLLGQITERFQSVEDPEFLRNAPVLAHELPRRVRVFLNDFRVMEPSGIALVSGLPVDQERIGRTPAHWHDRPEVSAALPEEVFFLLCCTLLGDVFGWSTQQDGHLMHDVIPIKGDEKAQLGSGSEQLLWWHTEDAFHPFRGDYVALMCLRNPDRVETTVAMADRIPWHELNVEQLFEPLYHIRPDESHLPQNRADLDVSPETEELLDAAYKRMAEMNTRPRKRPILSGDRRAPYMCLDPYFMDVEQLEEPARGAIEGLMRAIDRTLEPVVLEPGDCCFIDNYRAVHGRNPFTARYDGNDRWLKRLCITHSLRASREARLSSSDRIIF